MAIWVELRSRFHGLLGKSISKACELNYTLQSGNIMRIANTCTVFSLSLSVSRNSGYNKNHQFSEIKEDFVLASFHVYIRCLHMLKSTNGNSVFRSFSSQQFSSIYTLKSRFKWLHYPNNQFLNKLKYIYMVNSMPLQSYTNEKPRRRFHFQLKLENQSVWCDVDNGKIYFQTRSFVACLIFNHVFRAFFL